MACKELGVMCLLVIFLCNGAAEVLAGTCDPDCTGKVDFAKVTDPRDCRRYYVCLGGKPSPNSIACGPGQYFDGGNCTLHILPCTPVCGPDGGSGECRLTCSSTNLNISDPFNCGIYHTCVLGGLETVTCPDEAPYFDSSSSGGVGDCVTDESVCCVPGCTPHCSVANSLIPDPMDCAYYYLCLEEGTPQEELRMPCEEGQHFDLPLGKCSSTATCQVLCPETTTSVPLPTVNTDTGARTSSSVQPATTPSPSGCAEGLLCENVGLFRKCNSCHSQYFRCNEIGQPAVEKSCDTGFLFNPVSSFPHCILSSVCPYYPFIK